MKFKLFLLLLVFIGTIPVFAQDSLVVNAVKPESEFSVAINPIDSSNMVIATMHGTFSAGDMTVNIYYTKDFGTTWTKSVYHGYTGSYAPTGDPVLAFNDSGHVYFVNLIIAGNNVNTVLSKSIDGGATWIQVTTVETGSTDKPWIAIDRYAASPYKGKIYVPLIELGPSLVSMNSTYQSTKLTIPDGEHLPCVAVKKDGTVFTSDVTISGTNNRIYFQEYANGGTTLVHSTFIDSFPDYTHNAATGISARFQPTVYMAVDNSGGLYDGRVYMAYTSSEIGNSLYFDVKITHSDDNGVTWSTPKRVHSNQQAEIQQFYSSLYVNDAGTLIVDWYDRRNYANTNKNTDFYMGVSYDGGNTFNEVKLNTVSSDFDVVMPIADDFGIGEYHQVVATNNTAISFWSDGRINGDLNIYMAKVGLNNAGSVSVQEFSAISDKISISDLYPQPMINNVIYADISLKKNAKIKYEIYNMAGQKIVDSDWRQYSTGRSKMTIDFDYPAGSYIVKIMNDTAYFKSMKLVRK